MATLIFSGKILPERAQVNISDPIILEIPGDKFRPNFKTQLNIYMNQVIASVEVGSKEINIADIKSELERVVRSFIDLIGYLHGHSYDVEITSVWSSQDGSVRVFGIDLPVIDGSKEDRASRFPDLIPLMCKTPNVQQVLANLRESMRIPSDTGFFCYRAIENVMQGFREESENKKKAWEHMRESLNLSREWLEFVKGHADGPRHGFYEGMSWDDRQESMKRAWKILDRYFEYLKTGKPLSENDFPLLK